MFKLGQRLQTFIFGLSIGLIVGCLFFIFKLDDFFNRLSLFEKKNQSTIETKQDNQPNYDSLSNPNSENQLNTKKKQKSGSTYFYTSSDEEINVLKEEVLSVKNISLVTLSPEINSSNDSIIRTLSEVDKSKSTDLYLVEFRKTPLNSKGYMMTRNRVILYGIVEQKDLSIFKVNDSYFLKNNEIVYRLDHTLEFQPLEITEQSEVLQKINL